MIEALAPTEAPPARRRFSLGIVAFVVLMLALTALFVVLGVWQVNRLAEKEALIAAVSDRFTNPPIALPPVAEWVGFDPIVYDYRPVTFTGRFVHAGTVLVFTSLEAPKGGYGGAGYWVVAPFALNGGGTIFVNRGFVPQRLASSFATGGAGPEGTVTLTGIARQSEPLSSFTPAPDNAQRIDYVRNVTRLSGMADPGLAPFAPIYVDLPAGAPGALPQGGETIIDFPNNHFGYALTWFGFAILTPILLTIWLWRQLHPRRTPNLAVERPVH